MLFFWRFGTSGLDVTNRAPKSLNTVLRHSQEGVALEAQKASDLPRGVTVVYDKLFCDSVTDCTTPFLGRFQSQKLLLRYTIPRFNLVYLSLVRVGRTKALNSVASFLRVKGMIRPDASENLFPVAGVICSRCVAHIVTIAHRLKCELFFAPLPLPRQKKRRRRVPACPEASGVSSAALPT